MHPATVAQRAMESSALASSLRPRAPPPMGTCFAARTQLCWCGSRLSWDDGAVTSQERGARSAATVGSAEPWRARTAIPRVLLSLFG